MGCCGTTKIAPLQRQVHATASRHGVRYTCRPRHSRDWSQITFLKSVRRRRHRQCHQSGGTAKVNKPAVISAPREHFYQCRVLNLVEGCRSLMFASTLRSRILYAISKNTLTPFPPVICPGKTHSLRPPVRLRLIPVRAPFPPFTVPRLGESTRDITLVMIH
jgi:hypothetical protein